MHTLGNNINEVAFYWTRADSRQLCRLAIGDRDDD